MESDLNPSKSSKCESMSKLTIDVTKCPFCHSKGSDACGFDVYRCAKCGSQWRVSNREKVEDLRRRMTERFPDATP